MTAAGCNRRWPQATAGASESKRPQVVTVVKINKNTSFAQIVYMLKTNGLLQHHDTTTVTQWRLSSSRYMRGAAVLEALATFSSLSSTLACPAHCHSSIFLPLIAGLSRGLVLGIALGLWASWILLRLHSQALHPQPPVVDDRVRRRTSNRLQGYLHE